MAILRELKMLVVSDLHCHRFDLTPADSMLLAGGPRRPIAHHPMEALFKCIEKEGIAIDCVLAPGDFADKICQIGFSHSWQLLEELSWRLGRIPVIPALGNHDVDSRHKLGSDPFKIPRNLSPRFPFPDQKDFNKYFSQGFCRVNVTSFMDVVVLNSVVDHLDEKSAKRGAFGTDRIAELLSDLESESRPSGVRIALMHHHPLLHSSPVLSDEDVLPSGDQLLSVLGEIGCSLVVHGHKHHPRLTYVDTNGGRLPVLAAGSFSALLKELGSRTRNVFHVVELELTDAQEVLGSVKTWEWRQGEGWVPSSLQSSDFPHLTGFGAALTVNQMRDRIEELIREEPERWMFNWEELREHGVGIEYLTPAEFLNLSRKLEDLDWRLEARGDKFELMRLYTLGR